MAAAPAASVSATCGSPGKLHTEGLATLPFDLLTEHEAYDRRNVFEVATLGGRMVDAIRFARSDPELSRFPIGLFGASTGAAAALIASAEMLQDVPLWSPAAGGQTWQVVHFRTSTLRPCCSSAATTMPY
jgi:hypothetical protein